jgi:hypothetical protein
MNALFDISFPTAATSIATVGMRSETAGQASPSGCNLVLAERYAR